MIHIVTSSDGVQFAVQSANNATAAFDRQYASKLTGAELAKANPDFQQVKSLDELVAPEFVFSAPRISGPLERRASFTVIKGGKP